MSDHTHNHDHGRNTNKGAILTRCGSPRDAPCGWCSLVLAGIIAWGAILGGCGPQMPVAEYSIFGDPAHTWATVLQDGTVLVIMEPRENRTSRREGLSIEDFQSPTGRKGGAVIHYPKGIMELRMEADDVNKADSDMMYEWKMVQKGRIVQAIQVRVVPGRPVKVFVDEQEISRRMPLP